MNSPLLKLFTHPADAWLEIRRAEEDHPQQYLPRLLALALIPAVCLFVGTTTFGWSLAAEERVRLSMTSAAQLAGLLYATTVVGVMLMGTMIRWMSRGFDAQPSLNQCIGFAAYCATPWFFAGVVGLLPIRWLALAALLAASAYASVLLYGGLQTFLRLKKEQAMLFATCVWGGGVTAAGHHPGGDDPVLVQRPDAGICAPGQRGLTGARQAPQAIALSVAGWLARSACSCPTRLTRSRQLLRLCRGTPLRVTPSSRLWP